MIKYTESSWLPDEKLLVTSLCGNINSEDVKKWEASLHSATAKIPPETHFKAFINLHGFQATDLDAHKAMRSIIPLLLSHFNFKAGYVDLFENVSLPLISTNGIECTTVAHVHHDESKIKLYSERFDKDNERFFTNPSEGESWIKGR